METDRVVLSHLEIQNFKSYKDLVKIVLDEKYSALVGSNGTGKSNFLDAICFVMGQNVTQLRGNNLKDLIYGAIWNEEIPSGAYVKAYLKINGREESFKRTIDVHKCIYQISDKVVTYAKYVDNLEKIGIFAKVENFIVHQGEVEHIANMHKNDLTSKLDVLCGSYKLKDDYERLTNEKIRLEGKIASIHKDQNKILREIRNCKALKKEAGKLTVLQKEIEYRQTTLKVYELYVLKESIAKLECKLTEHLVHVDTIESKKQTIFESTDTLRRELKQLNRELWEIEQRNLKTYADIAKQRDPYVQAQEEIIGLRKQLDSAEKNLAKAVEEKNAYEHSIQNVERNYNLFLSEITDSELSTSTIISLEESQLRDYYNIKNESDKKTALLTCEQINIDRAIKQREDNLNRLMMEKQTLQNQKVALEAKIVKMDSEKYERQIQSMNLELTEIQQRSDQIGRLQERQNILLNEIEENKCRLQEARCSKEDYFEEKRRQSVLTRLKELHEGVYGRFLDLCQPIHARYNIAATKVVRKYLFAIVVDTESTAKSCISTLKMEKLGIETFLPLDSISTKRIIENLRNREEENIRLLIDVLQYENTIYRAVNHVIGNTLVCKTPDDADKASLDYNQNAVALDGTMFFKSGLMSGGESDLMRKARRWDHRNLVEIKIKVEEYEKELRDVIKEIKTLKNKSCEKKGIEIRLRMMKNFAQEMAEQKNSMNETINEIISKIQEVDGDIETISEDLEAYYQKLNELKRRIKNIVDEEFRDFCTNIGIMDIEQYEKGGLQEQRKREQTKLDRQKEIDKMLNKLEYMKQQDRTTVNVDRLTKVVENYFNKLTRCEMEWNKTKTQFLRLDSLLKGNELLIVEKQTAIKTAKDKLHEAEQQLKEISETYLTLQSSTKKLDNDLLKLKNNRHKVFMDCKVQTAKKLCICCTIRNSKMMSSANDE